MSDRPDPTEDVRQLYEDAGKRTAAAMEVPGQARRVRRAAVVGEGLESRSTA
jgi:hypothetical protein